jgi:hypothetical protein
VGAPKSELGQFGRWVLGMPSECPPRLRWLYQCAALVRMFPGYRLAEVRRMNGADLRELLQAAELLSTAEKLQRASGG